MQETPPKTTPEIDPIAHWNKTQDHKMSVASTLTKNLDRLNRIYQAIDDCPDFLKPIARFLLGPASRKTEERIKEYRQAQKTALEIEKDARAIVQQLMEMEK